MSKTMEQLRREHKIEKENAIKKYKSDKRIQKLVQEYNSKEIEWFDLITNPILNTDDIMHLMSAKIIKRWKTDEEIQEDKEKERLKKLKSKLNEKELAFRKELNDFLLLVEVHNMSFYDPKTKIHHHGWGFDQLEKEADRISKKYTLGQMRKVLTNEEFKDVKKKLYVYGSSKPKRSNT